MRSFIPCIFILFLAFSTAAQTDKLYTSFDGLSNAEITAIIQDNKGIMWIGTARGVNKYDGYSFEVFVNDPADSNSFQSNRIEALASDSKGQVWAGISKGLYRYNKINNKFERFSLLFEGRHTYPKVADIQEDKYKNLWLATNMGPISVNLNTDEVTFYNPPAVKNPDFKIEPLNCLAFDDQDRIWFGSDGYGLSVFDPVKNENILFKKKRSGTDGISDNGILSLMIDKKGNVIMGTIMGGISIYQPSKNKFINIPLSNDPSNKFSGAAYSIIEDKKGTIWVGTERNGIKILDTENFKLIDANHMVKVDGMSDSRTIFYEDKDGNLWIGIDHKGLYLKKSITKPFHSITKEQGLSNNIVKSIYFDKAANLWIGTDGGGLNMFSKDLKKLAVFQHDPNDKKSISDNAIITLLEDKNNNLWIGSYLGGLSVFDKNTATFTNYLNDSTREGSNYNYFTSIIDDRNEGIWIGIMGMGIYNFDLNTRRFTGHQKALINGKWQDLPLYINILFLDNENNLWIGSYNGLYLWNAKKGVLKSFTKSNKLLKSDEIFDIMQDRIGNIWVGTSSGLYKITDSKITRYAEQDGLASNTMHSILEDEHHNLWIGTENGLSKFDPVKKQFINYFTRDGLPSNEFRYSSRFKREDGMLYFGTASGLVYFHPDSIKESERSPKLLLSRLKLFNKDVPVGKTENKYTILDKPLDDADNIHLKYSDNSFTIEFAAIDFNVPEKIKYAYMMEGFDSEWNIRNYYERSATYTNLNPGTYTFKIRSTNSDGIWSDNLRSIEVIITPPWWKTWWARMLYMIAILITLYIARKLMLMRWEMKNAFQMEILEREKKEEINQSKLRFFTNISHEFRTPLTLIIAPVEKLMDKEDNPSLRKQIKLIHSNAMRMLRMFNQLLELQKVEDDKMVLQKKPWDIVEFIKGIVDPFAELLQDKKIELCIDLPESPLIVWFDSDKLDKVIFNILSNAYKFTPENGKISIGLEVKGDPTIENKVLKITISDTGIGINKEYFDKIFNRFYQVESKISKTATGTGIGLHLAKTFVELHGGEIKVDSEEGKGSVFTISLPIEPEVEGDLELVSDTLFINPRHNREEILSEEDVKYFKEESEPRKDLYKVLVADDDKQILNFLKLELSEDYKVLEAVNGKEGLAIAQSELPDLIISDIMMPEMDGIEFCREVKTDINTCHIPVILLTAKSSIENRIQGLETGADSYIPKPFHLNHLKTRIQKLIELRENLKKKFSRSMNFEAKEMTVMSADEKFLQNAITFVKENMSDSDLNIEDMGKQLGMSRAQLYRKIKSLTDQSPSEFVRTIRLKQAAYLLTQNKLNISEIAYHVGFNSPQYFTNSFREYFNMSPSEYLQKAKESSLMK